MITTTTGNFPNEFVKEKSVGALNMPLAWIEKITIDMSSANSAAIESHNTEIKAGIDMCRIKYLNNIVEEEHPAIKRQTRPMLRFKSFVIAHPTRATASTARLADRTNRMVS